MERPIIVNHPHAHTSTDSVVFYCHMLQNHQSHKHSLCGVMSHLVLSAHRTMLRQSYKNFTAMNLSALNFNTIKKILDKKGYAIAW